MHLLKRLLFILFIICTLLLSVGLILYVCINWSVTAWTIIALIAFFLYLLIGFWIAVCSFLFGKDFVCLEYVFPFQYLVILLFSLPILYVSNYIKHYREAKSRNISMRQLKAEYMKQDTSLSSLDRLYLMHSLEYDEE